MTEPSQIQAGRLSDLISADFPPDPCWITPNILPKRCKMILGAAAYSAKSMILLSLGRALALAESPLGCPDFAVDRPTKILYIEHEVKPYGLQQRVKKIFGDLDPDQMAELGKYFYYVSGEPTLQFSSPDGRDALNRLVDEVEPEVLILDPIGKMHYFDENDNGQVARLMYYIDLLLKRGKDLGLSVIFTHHFGKPSDDPTKSGNRDPLDPYNYRGASKWKDDPDVRVTMQRGQFIQTPGDWRAFNLKMRIEPRQGEQMPDLNLRWNEDGDLRVKFDRFDKLLDGQSKTAPPKLIPQPAPNPTPAPVIVMPPPDLSGLKTFKGFAATTKK